MVAFSDGLWYGEVSEVNPFLTTLLVVIVTAIETLRLHLIPSGLSENKFQLHKSKY